MPRRRGPGPQVPYIASLRGQFHGPSVDVAAVRALSPADIQAPLPGALGPEGGRPVVLPGINFPPAGAVPVDEDGDQNIAPAATATLLTFLVPNAVRLRVVGIGFGADDEVALRFLTWSMQINAATVPGYVQKNAVIGTIVQLTDIFQLVQGSQTLTIVGTASALAGLTYRYICRIRGYLYSEREF